VLGEEVPLSAVAGLKWLARKRSVNMFAEERSSLNRATIVAVATPVIGNNGRVANYNSIFRDSGGANLLRRSAGGPIRFICVNPLVPIPGILKANGKY
jgi:hypothetical protein